MTDDSASLHDMKHSVMIVYRARERAHIIISTHVTADPTHFAMISYQQPPAQSHAHGTRRTSFRFDPGQYGFDWNIYV